MKHCKRIYLKYHHKIHYNLAMKDKRNTTENRNQRPHKCSLVRRGPLSYPLENFWYGSIICVGHICNLISQRCNQKRLHRFYQRGRYILPDSSKSPCGPTDTHQAHIVVQTNQTAKGGTPHVCVSLKTRLLWSDRERRKSRRRRTQTYAAQS